MWARADDLRRDILRVSVERVQLLHTHTRARAFTHFPRPGGCYDALLRRRNDPKRNRGNWIAGRASDGRTKRRREIRPKIENAADE